MFSSLKSVYVPTRGKNGIITDTQKYGVSAPLDLLTVAGSGYVTIALDFIYRCYNNSAIDEDEISYCVIPYSNGDLPDYGFLLCCVYGNMSIFKCKNAPYDYINEGFQLACREGQIDIVKHILKMNLPSFNVTANNNGALHEALENGHLSIVKLLIENGCLE